jgi:hypothetical protein
LRGSRTRRPSRSCCSHMSAKGKRFGIASTETGFARCKIFRKAADSQSHIKDTNMPLCLLERDIPWGNAWHESRVVCASRMTDPTPAPAPPHASPNGSPPKLLDQVRQAIRLRHAAVASPCQVYSGPSTPTRRSNGRGNGCFPRRVSTSTESPASGADITCTSLCSSAPLRTPRALQGFRVQPRHTHFAIRSRPIFLKPGMTSAQSKNC